MSINETETLRFRETAGPADAAAIRRIVASTGMFRDDEIDVAVELVDDRRAKGDLSGYYFTFAEMGGQPVGYACFGPIACTVASFDLYWIAVERLWQGKGLGRLLIEESQRRIRAMGGARIYVDTSGRTQYAPTRRFYEHCGYDCAAVLPDFYAPGDDRVIYVKVLET